MMLDSYGELEISADGLEYRFFSAGPKGSILKVIVFSTTGMPNIFNLAFGNLNNDGSIDDLTVNDNKDRNKILATVVTVVYKFTLSNPDKTIFFAGSTPARTRLYRMAITIYYEILKTDFDIFGIIREADVIVDQPL